MKRSSRIFLLVPVLTACLALPGMADQYNTPPVRKVTVVGTNIIKVVPDEMRWTISVSIKDATIAKAKARHDASLDAALKFIKSLGDAAKYLQTGGIRIDKQTYFADKEDRSKPFSCSTQVTFTLIDFDKYGPICDALSKLDGIEVQSVDYATSKEASLRREALKSALLDAHDKANDLAVTAGCYIDKPLEINEQEAYNVRPEAMSKFVSDSAGGGTPGAVAGQLEITAKVTATYDLFYK